MGSFIGSKKSLPVALSETETETDMSGLIGEAGDGAVVMEQGPAVELKTELGPVAQGEEADLESALDLPLPSPNS